MYTSPSGKRYVGQTCNPKEVRAGSKGNGYRRCTAFWRAIQKYGWENFDYVVLEENISEQDIDSRENYWMNYYHTSTDENGYNLLKPDGNRKTYSQETIRKLSESHKGQVAWNKGKTNVYSEESLKKMSESHKGKTGHMLGKHHTEETKRKISERTKGHRALRGEENPMYGKHLSEETKKKMSEKLKGKFAGENNPMYGVHLTVSEETKRKISEASSVPVMQFDLDGNYIQTFKSRKAAAIELNISQGGISACCCGRKKSSGGYQWCNVGDENNISKYKSNEKQNIPVVKMLNGEIIDIYESICQANKSMNKSGSNIIKCLRGDIHTCYGYQWERLDNIDIAQITEFYRKNAS